MRGFPWRRLLATVLVAGVLLGGTSAVWRTAAWAQDTPKPLWQTPRVEGLGGVVSIPQASDPPRPEAKIVLDATAGPGDGPVHPVIERTARLLNLYELEGPAARPQAVIVVLHGGATTLALDDAAYAAAFDTADNPHRQALAKLRAAGVTLAVCGQSLARGGYPLDVVADDIEVVHSAMTTLVNKQAQGFAYVPID